MKKCLKLCRNYTVLLLCLMLVSCKKYLEQKPDKQMAVAATLADVRALLDNYSAFNSNYPSLGDRSDDNFYLDDTRFNSLNIDNRNNYIWADNAVNDYEWGSLYQKILNATAALETLEAIERAPVNADLWDELKGTALFHRGFALYHAVQYYATVYDSSTATAMPGIPLRLSTSVTHKSVRAGMAETWEHIEYCFKEAAALLPVHTSFKTRPDRAAAHAALARTYLAMGRFSVAAVEAAASLELHNQLIDFNPIDPAAPMPFTRFNDEVIFACSASPNYTVLNLTVYTLDTGLYASYHADDLRKELYFSQNGYGGYGFKGSYDGDMWGGSFIGIATDEVMLIKAECLARTGQFAAAMDVLNTLLVTRWRAGSYVPFTASGAAEALQIILEERRKELIQRGTRWFDLRRLGQEAATAVSPVRQLDGQTIVLEPGSSRYTFLIPQKVIDLTGMEQNVR